MERDRPLLQVVYHVITQLILSKRNTEKKTDFSFIVCNLGFSSNYLLVQAREHV